jgi:hypothetical protein
MFRRAYQLVHSNFGRESGWNIELHGKIIGELNDPQWDDMFWVSYRIVANCPDEYALLNDGALWDGCKFQVFSKLTGELVDRAIAWGHRPPIHDGRISMRALYLEPKSLLEDCLVIVLRFFVTSKKST